MDPLKVSEEEMAMDDVFAKGVKAVAECRRLEGLVSRYQRRCERLQADLEGRESDKNELHRQLEKAAAEQSRPRSRAISKAAPTPSSNSARSC